MHDLGRGPIGVDTSVWIYLMEVHPVYLPVVEPVFRAADAGRCDLVTSAVTLLEVLVVPYRSGNRQLAERYEKLLTHGRGIHLVDLTHV